MASKLLTEYQLETLRCRAGLVERVECTVNEDKEYRRLTEDGQPLPEGVHEHIADNGEPMRRFYRLKILELTDSERDEYIRLRQLDLLRQIRNCAIAIAVAVVLSAIVVIGL